MNQNKKSTRVWIASLISMLLFFVLPAQTEAAGFTKAQTGVDALVTVATNTISCAFASNPATGSLVTVGVAFYDAGTTPPTFTVADGTSNSYTVDSNNSGSTNMNTAGYVGQAYLLSAPSNANKTITVTFSKNFTAAEIWCDNWTSSGGTARYDSGNVGSGTSAITTPTITVSNSDELVYCTATDANGVNAATSPFTSNEGTNATDNHSEWVTGQSANRACAFAGTASQVYNAVGMSFVSGAVNLALNKPAVASSEENPALLPASATFDGNATTRWSSVFSDPQWIYVDLMAKYMVTGVSLVWEDAYATSFKIQASNDAVNWTDIYTTTTGTGGTQDLTVTPTTARYIRMYGTVRATPYGYSLWEMEVYGTELVTRQMRLFEGFKIKFTSGRIILHQKQ